MKGLRGGLVLALLAPLILLSPAFADSQWSMPMQLSTKTSGTFDAQLLLSPDGRTALAVWVDRKGEQYTLVSRVGATSSAGVKWASTENLSSPARFPFPFHVAWSGDGNTLVVAWQNCKSSAAISFNPCWLQTRVGRFLQGSIDWGLVSEFQARVMTVSDPEIALSRDGKKISAIWVDNNAGTSDIGYASGAVTYEGIAWEPAQTLASTTNGSNLPNGSSFSQSGMALSEDGSLVTVVWVKMFERDARGVIETRSGSGNGPILNWTPVRAISPESGFAGWPVVRASADGRRLLASWYVGEGYREVVAIESALGSFDGSIANWSALGGPAPRSQSLPLVAVNLFDASEGPQIVMSKDGRRAVATWIRKNVNQVLPQYAIIDLQSEGAIWSGPDDIVPLASGSGIMGGIRLAASEDGHLFKTVWQDRTGYPTSREGRLESGKIFWTRSGNLPGLSEAAQLVSSFDGRVALVSSWNPDYDGLKVATLIPVSQVTKLPKSGSRCKASEAGKVVMRGGQSRECLPDRNRSTLFYWYSTGQAAPSPGKALIANWESYAPPVATFESIASCRAVGTDWEFVLRWKLTGGNSIQAISEPVDLAKTFSQMQFVTKYLQVDSTRTAITYSLISSRDPYLTWSSLEVSGASVPFNYKELSNAAPARLWGSHWLSGPTEPGPNPWTPIVLGSAAACKK